VTIPQTKLLEVLHEALARTGQDVDLLVQRLTAISAAEEHAETTEEVVALGFLACVKALRETSLLQEVAIREEIQQIHDLGEELLGELDAIRRAESLLRRKRRAFRSARAKVARQRTRAAELARRARAGRRPAGRA
jgi:hypothetical protein